MIPKDTEELVYDHGSTDLTIDGRKIGVGHKPYVIAELSACHNGNFDSAIQLIEIAKGAGADAVKIQTYTPDTITLDCDRPEFFIRGGLWDGQSLYQLYKNAHTPWEWHEHLFAKAQSLGITLFSSPFDNTAVELLENLNAPAYKIASFELVDLPLISRVAQVGKPMIMSTGMATLAEIEEAITCAMDHGAQEVALLHCVSGYPAPAGDYNLKTMADLKAKTGLPVGLSDHSIGSTTAIGAVSLGACIVEKHLTLDRNGGGPDDSFAIEPEEFVAYCRDINLAFEALGNVQYGMVESESGNIQFRRSLYAVDDIGMGDPITAANVRSIRPGNGLAPKHLPNLMGRRTTKHIKRGTPMHWDLVAK